MKIALVTETYPPEINGVAMTLSQLVEGLREKGHETQVVRPLQPTEDRDEKATSDTIAVRGFPIPRYPDLRFGLPRRKQLLRIWSANRPDLVHVATEGPLGLSAIGAARRLKIPVTSTFHTNFHSYSKHYNARFLSRAVLAFLRWTHNKTQCTMAPTQELADELSGQGFANMAVFGRGVRLNIFRPAARDESLRHVWGARPDDLVVVHVSRLAAEKNYELLGETYSQIRERVPHSQFVIVGGGPLEAQLRERFPFAHFTGPVPLENREALARIYASADVFIYPSQTETYGNVTTEAMASGLAVVAFDYAAARLHIINGENGLVAPLDDADAFIEASLQVAQDLELRKRIGANANAYAPALDWQPVIDRFEDILQQVQSGRSISGR